MKNTIEDVEKVATLLMEAGHCSRTVDYVTVCQYMEYHIALSSKFTHKDVLKMMKKLERENEQDDKLDVDIS